MAQAPHHAVREQGYLPPGGGVFISRWHHGSPAHRYGLYALNFITEVNSVPTPDLPAFLDVVRRLVRLPAPCPQPRVCPACLPSLASCAAWCVLPCSALASGFQQGCVFAQ